MVGPKVETDPVMGIVFWIPMPSTDLRENRIVVIGVGPEPFFNAREDGLEDPLAPQDEGLHDSRHPAVPITEGMNHHEIEVCHRRGDYR